MTEVDYNQYQLEIHPRDFLVPEGFVYTNKQILEEVTRAVNGPRYPGYPEAGLKMTLQEYADWEKVGRPVDRLIGSPSNPTAYFVEHHENRYFPDGSLRNKRIQPYGNGETFAVGQFGKLNTASDGSPLHPFFKEIVTSPESRGFITGPGWYWALGENDAADPFIYRMIDGKFQFLAIMRYIDKVFALPGGMKEGAKGLSKTATKALELARDTASREGNEETGVVGLEKSKSKILLESVIVGDIRSTAQSWPRTSVVSFALPFELAMNQKLKAGDDAMEVVWMDATEENIASLYASHPSYVRLGILDFQKETGLVIDKKGKIGRPTRQIVTS